MERGADNVPNRDCMAKASQGELCCVQMHPADRPCERKWGGNCDYGLQRYRQDFLAPIAALLQAHARVPVALVIEPDSLANLVTGHAGECQSGATRSAYRNGIAAAVSMLAPLAAGTYLDAGHGGWMSFEHNLHAFAALVDSLGVAPNLRGFAINVANYQPLGSGVCEWALLQEDKPQAACPRRGGGSAGEGWGG